MLMTTKKIDFFFFLMVLFFVTKSFAVDTHQNLPGQLNPDEYLVSKNSEIINKSIRKGESSLNFTYYRDTFDYGDSRGSFKRTYDDGFQSVRAGILQIGYDEFIYKGPVDLSLGGNVGIGHSRGRGSFAGGETSDTTFQLWSIPVDFIVALDIPLYYYAKFGVYVGPSLMGLMQTRNDKNHSESKKTRNQFSYGYVAGARFRLGLSEIFPASMFGFFSNYNISNVYINIEMQTRNYSHFLDKDISIEGSSIGLGFSFEYL